MQQQTITETAIKTFQFIVTGQVLSIDGVKHVVLQDGMKFRLAKLNIISSDIFYFTL